MSGGDLSVYGIRSPSYQRKYIIPMPDGSSHWGPEHAQLQPSDNCEDSIPNYGTVGWQVGYDGIYRRKAGPAVKQTDCGHHRTLLATAGIDHDEYGPVRSDYDIMNNGVSSINGTSKSGSGTFGGSTLEYVKSEIAIKTEKGEPVYGVNSYHMRDNSASHLPVQDPIPSYLPPVGDMDYDGRKEYEWQSHIWTTRDLPNYSGYDNYGSKRTHPSSIGKLDFERRVQLIDPELAKGTAGSLACDFDQASDELDPRVDSGVMDSKKFRSPNYIPPLANYDDKYINMKHSYDYGKYEDIEGFGQVQHSVSLQQSRTKSARAIPTQKSREKFLTWEQTQDMKLARNQTNDWAKDYPKEFAGDARSSHNCTKPNIQNNLIKRSPFDSRWDGLEQHPSLYSNVEYMKSNAEYIKTNSKKSSVIETFIRGFKDLIADRR